MFKTMLKKQLLSFKNFFLTDRRTGKRRSTIKTIGFCLLMAFVFLMLGVSMFAVAFLMGDTLLDGSFMGGNRFDWLYFSMMGVMTLLFGILGSVFTTYQSIYKAKDNDLLLSMPIKSEYIIGSRLISISLLALAYSAVIWIPTMLVYWIIKMPTIPTIVFPIVMMFFNALFVVAISCALGYLVALISSKLPKNNLLTVGLYLVFFGIYYYFCFNMESIFMAMAENVENISSSISTFAYPIYLMGRGAAGDLYYFFGYLALAVILFAICWLLLNRSFIKIATSNKGEKKVQYVEKDTKAKDIRGALFNRELKRFLSSATYMMNTGLGIPFGLVACVFAIIKKSTVTMVLDLLCMEMPFVKDLLPIFALSTVFMMGAMVDVTAPSISLEGKNLWVIRSMPVNTADVLKAKSNLGVVLGLIPTLAMSLTLSYVLNVGWQAALLMLVCSYLFACLCADFGLMMNLLRPSLDWPNEVAPIKQSIPVFVCLFGGWVFAAGIAFVGYLLRDTLTGLNFLLALMVALALVCRLIRGWLYNKGVKIFESL